MSLFLFNQDEILPNQDPTLKISAAILTPILGINQHCKSILCDGAVPAEIDGNMQINIFFRSVAGAGGNIELVPEHPIRVALEQSQYYKHTLHITEQSRVCFIFSWPEEFEQDLYYFCAQSYSKISTKFRNICGEIYPELPALFDEM